MALPDDLKNIVAGYLTSEKKAVDAYKLQLIKDFENTCHDYKNTKYVEGYGDRDEQFDYKLCDIKIMILEGPSAWHN